MTSPHARKRLRRRRIGYALAGVLAPALVGALIYQLITGAAGVPRKNVPEVVQLRIIQPPPPPPPPPPPKEKMVEPPKLREAVKMEPIKAAPRPDNSPPALDAKGQGPGDAFGLAGRPGGSDYLGGGGGGGGDPFGWYSGLFEGRAREALQKQRRLLGFHYRIPVEVWLDDQGVAQRVELISTTGNPEVDRVLREGLLRMPRMPEPPPKGMPQPMVIMVSSS